MLTLALDTALAACTVGLVADGVLLHASQIAAPRGHAERLIPQVALLLETMRDKGAPAEPAHIAVTLGPGSYTGLRVGLAAARAFGLAWDVPVAGCDTLTPIHRAYQHAHPEHDQDIVVAHEAGRGWIYAQRYAAQSWVATPIVALEQDALAAFGAGAHLLGSANPSLAPHYRFPDPVWIAACAAQNPARTLDPLYVRAQTPNSTARAF
jgi:tRNA threonylcarbamoyladenosine biosynthesis protein TsaB